MIRSFRAFALVLGLAACGAAKPAPAVKTAAPPPPPTVDASPMTCEDACTTYAACWEEENGRDFHGGGECVTACEELDEQARATYFTCVGSGDCTKVTAC